MSVTRRRLDVAVVEELAHHGLPILRHSGVWFVKAYPKKTTWAFLDGHVSGFVSLGRVPRWSLYDTATLAAARILGDSTCQRNRALSFLQPRHLFRDRFSRPGKGNEKGKVSIPTEIFSFVPTENFSL
ncbi:MAG: hypothetical protein OXH87_08125 [Rhodospirillaceae bacterium]|nr:hypothetical protein [Rhodospirillaceae bacterium]